MKLIEAVQQLAKLDDDFTIYAREPWTPSTDARVALEGSEEEKKISAEGLRYFIEVFIARDFLEDWRPTQKKAPTEGQCCGRLIEYATNDAYLLFANENGAQQSDAENERVCHGSCSEQHAPRQL
jgi:hypothetical protein